MPILSPQCWKQTFIFIWISLYLTICLKCPELLQRTLSILGSSEMPLFLSFLSPHFFHFKPTAHTETAVVKLKTWLGGDRLPSMQKAQGPTLSTIPVKDALAVFLPWHPVFPKSLISLFHLSFPTVSVQSWSLLAKACVPSSFDPGF